MENQLTRNLGNQDLILAECKKHNEANLIVKTTLEKCFLAAGYNVNEDVLSVILEYVYDELPNITLEEFITKIKKFRIRNKQRISVPLIIEIFFPEQEYTVISTYN